MLSFQTLSGGNGRSGSSLSSYFEKEADTEDYWVKDSVLTPQWFGEGAKELDMVGKVKQQDFMRTMNRVLPDGTQLPKGRGGKWRMGYDLTFSAPKSISMQILVGGDERLMQAVQEAAKETLQSIEQNTLTSQAKVKGKIKHEHTGKMVAATFTHETSRELDPQVHIHSVVANMTKTEDGKWRALYDKPLKVEKKAHGSEFRTRLQDKAQRLGYKITITNEKENFFELSHISQKQIREFSKRRVEIERHLPPSGASAQVSQRVALSTRPKKVTLSTEQRKELSKKWVGEAKKVGMDLGKQTQKARKDAGKFKPLSRDAARKEAKKAVDKALVTMLKKPGQGVYQQKVAQAAAGYAKGRVSPQMLRQELVNQVNSGKIYNQGKTIVPSKAFSNSLALKRVSNHAKSVGAVAGRVVLGAAKTGIKHAILPPGTSQLLRALRVTNRVGKDVGREEGRGVGR